MVISLKGVVLYEKIELKPICKRLEKLYLLLPWTLSPTLKSTLSNLNPDHSIIPLKKKFFSVDSVKKFITFLFIILKSELFFKSIAVSCLNI